MNTLMGGETEYAIAATLRDGAVMPQPVLLTKFMAVVRDTLPYTSVSSHGRFLPNGGLIYLDAGLHMEWATPECSSPHDTVRYLRAGDRIVHGLAEQFARTSPLVASVFCTRCNVDYLERTLWASHESYLHRRSPHSLPDWLIPFLVSRVVLSGAGGWDSRSPGLAFTLSPRAHCMTEIKADNTQHVRPIFSTKNEGLSRTGSHRLHVGCSETLCSDLATLLRFGTTALVVAAIDAGAPASSAITLASPLTAIRRFAADPHCRARASLLDGRLLTAVEIQRLYLRFVEERLGAAGMPAWAESICVLWRQMLNRLEVSPEQTAFSLDWAIKQRIYTAALAREGIRWPTLPTLNSVLRALARGLVRSSQAFNGDAVCHVSDTLLDAAYRSVGVTDTDELTREKLAAVLRLRETLMEIDMRFGQLGDEGIFSSLDRAGVLSHRVAGVDAIGEAVESPPEGTRAAVRGRVVRRLTQHATRYRAEWTRIVDVDNHRVLDLGDPFESEERWSSLPDDLSRRPSHANRMAELLGQ